jgi:AbiV family abortive infection protein
MKSKTDAAKKKRDGQLRTLAEGAAKSFENAEALYREATILREHGCTSRALFLHQISLEECGKIEIIGGWATSILAGHKVDVSKLAKVMANHKSKNSANSYFLPVEDGERKGRQNGDWKAAHAVFKKQKEQFHLESNTAKNASLYVDFANETFTMPSERITDEMVEEISQRNHDFLCIAFPKTEILSRWINSDLDNLENTITQSISRLMELKNQYPNDPDQALSIFFDEFMQQNTSIQTTK